MLLWMPTRRPSGMGDDDEKGVKVQRQAQAKKAKHALLICLTVMTTLFVVVLLQLHQNPSSVTGKVRSRRDAVDQKRKPPVSSAGHHDKEIQIFDPHADLPPDSIYRLTVKDQLGDPFPLIDYAGKVTLIVNTACKCGKTQVSFKQLTDLHEKYEGQGFSVLGFPSNDFRQELPGNEQIQNFLNREFPQLAFPVLGESSLKENPVYRQLQQHLPDKHVQHNFYKYLVDRRGIAVDLFPKQREPITLESEIEALLKKQPLPSPFE